METRITVIDGMDGFTPDMLRQRFKVVYDRTVPVGSAYAVRSQHIVFTGPRPWWADPMHD